MRISFITTIFNEEKTIESFLDSLLLQTRFPDDIVIVDAGSTDKTTERIKKYEAKFKTKKIGFKILIKKGNRSVGRNEAIKNATGDIIVASDAGCTLDKKWIEKITEPFRRDSSTPLRSVQNDKRVDVVAGYYHPVTKTVFEKCLAPYMCVKPDRVNPEDFLPSSRSVAFRKEVWGKAGGYPERLDTCEDLVFARTLQRMRFHFTFAKDAIVYWQQRHNFKEAFLQFYSYAVGDGQALYIRPQTPLLFLRYAIGILAVIFYFTTHSSLLLVSLFVIFFLYMLWAIRKNYRYVKDWRALYILPLLQFTADIAVLAGTVRGLLLLV